MTTDEVIKSFTLVPADYKDKDPRQLAYHFGKEIVSSERALITYNKYISKFIFYHSLQAAEQAAKTVGRILIPAECIHWRRATALSNRRIFVGRRSYYLLSPDELQKSEKKKLIGFLKGEGLL